MRHWNKGWSTCLLIGKLFNHPVLFTHNCKTIVFVPQFAHVQFGYSWTKTEKASRNFIRSILYIHSRVFRRDDSVKYRVYLIFWYPTSEFFKWFFYILEARIFIKRKHTYIYHWNSYSHSYTFSQHFSFIDFLHLELLINPEPSVSIFPPSPSPKQ